VLFGLFGVWLTFALALNWAGVSERVFFALCMSPEAIAQGQIWRLLTAPFLHLPSELGHILGALIGLYFLAPSLEASWGSARFLRFLGLSTLLAYGTQTLAAWLLPVSLGAKLMASVQFGALPAVEAVAIAWACSFRGQTVQLFFVLPVTSRGLILFVVGFSILALIAGQTPPSGHIALFSAMVYGWLLGGGTPSPLRRAYLSWKLARLDQEVIAERHQRQKRVARSGLRVIEGGEDKNDKNDPKMLH